MTEEQIDKEFEKLGYKKAEDNEEVITYYKDNHGECCCYDEVITVYKDNQSYNKYDGSHCGYQLKPTEKELSLIIELADLYM